MQSVDPLLTRSLATRLASIGRDYRRHLDQGLAGLSLSHTAALAVMLVGRVAGGVRQGALADQLGIEAPSIVPLIDQLERTGLVERSVDATDKRARLIRLTTSGSAIAAQVEQCIEAIRQELFAGISAVDLVVADRVLETLHRRLLDGETP